MNFLSLLGAKVDIGQEINTITNEIQKYGGYVVAALIGILSIVLVMSLIVIGIDMKMHEEENGSQKYKDKMITIVKIIGLIIIGVVVLGAVFSFLPAFVSENMPSPTE